MEDPFLKKPNKSRGQVWGGGGGLKKFQALSELIIFSSKEGEEQIVNNRDLSSSNLPSVTEMLVKVMKLSKNYLTCRIDLKSNCFYHVIRAI